MKSTILALLLAIALFPASALAQPLADRVPGDALIYIGCSGSEKLGPEYEQSHLKAVIAASDVSKIFSDFLPKLSQRMSRDNPGAGEKATLIGNLGARLWKHPSAFYWGGIDFTNPRNPTPRFAILCDAGDEAAALMKDVQE